MTTDATPARRESCTTCRWWDECRSDPDAVRFVGICRRHAPRPVTPLQVHALSFVEAVWPTTDHEDFCGDWQPRPGSPDPAAALAADNARLRAALRGIVEAVEHTPAGRDELRALAVAALAVAALEGRAAT